MKITDIEWLAPPGLKGQKLSQTDLRKRKEIFYEFLYYLVDSLLIPLIRSNFYVTESSSHKYRLFFFRHDIWRHVAEPAMATLKAKMFEEVKLEDALQILDSRQIGFSQIRLMPKNSSMRPITNLRRRTLARGNSKILGPSINSILGPVNTVLNLEKVGRGPEWFPEDVTNLWTETQARASRFCHVLGGRPLHAHQDIQAAPRLDEAQVVFCQSRRSGGLRHHSPGRCRRADAEDPLPSPL